MRNLFTFFVDLRLKCKSRCICLMLSRTCIFDYFLKTWSQLLLVVLAPLREFRFATNAILVILLDDLLFQGLSFRLLNLKGVQLVVIKLFETSCLIIFAFGTSN